MRWPKHNESLRADELRLFAELHQKWGDRAFDSHSSDDYSDVVATLNTVFGTADRQYTAQSVRKYVERVHNNARYRWPATRQHRYDVWRDEIEAERARLYGPWQRQPSKPAIPLPLRRKSRSCNAAMSFD
jgi:hypothetical protein